MRRCNGIDIRPARAEDIPHLCDLLSELFSSEADFEPDRAKQARGLALLLNDPAGRSHVAVAVLGNAVIGMATVQTLISTAEGDRVGIVEDVVVDRHFRGRGVGTRLLDHLNAWGREMGLKRLQLLADRENASAVDFYRSQSWTSTRLVCMRQML